MAYGKSVNLPGLPFFHWTPAAGMMATPGRRPVRKVDNAVHTLIFQAVQLVGHVLVVVRVAGPFEGELRNFKGGVSGTDGLGPLLPCRLLVIEGQRALQSHPVSADLYGANGDHQLSVAMLFTSDPSAFTSAGNSSTLATVASLGLKPCSAASFQNVLKSGGSGTFTKISQSCDLKSRDH